jgi:hypothetical protein
VTDHFFEKVSRTQVSISVCVCINSSVSFTIMFFLEGGIYLICHFGLGDIGFLYTYWCLSARIPCITF